VIARNIVGDDEFVVMNISPVVDTINGTRRIIVLFNKSEHNEWDLNQGIGFRRVFCIFSDDHGLTWHSETDITSQVHKPYNPAYSGIYPYAALEENKNQEWRIQTPTLGHAIQLQGTPANPVTSGRLFHVGVLKRSSKSVFYGENYAFWSDDLGETWKIGGIIEGKRKNGANGRGLGEACAVELENGGILINSRNYLDGKPVGVRAKTRASFDDEGNIHFEPTEHDQTLVEPTVEGSMIRYTYSWQKEYGGKSRILFCNPNHPKGRYNLTIRMSYDEGETWPVSKVIDPGPSAYSDLVIQEDMKIGVIYEQGNHGGLHYVNFPLDWLTDGKDSFCSDK
jgi:hypothetical protein